MAASKQRYKYYKPVSLIKESVHTLLHTQLNRVSLGMEVHAARAHTRTLFELLQKTDLFECRSSHIILSNSAAPLTAQRHNADADTISLDAGALII